MLSKLHRFLALKNYLPGFLVLLMSYFVIGLFLISYTPITTDEIAHLSAAQGITAGLDLNLEHPPLLKGLNAIPLNILYNDFQSSSMGQDDRSVSFLTQTNYRQKDIISVSRTVYLLFNSLLLSWLLFYTIIFKMLKPGVGLILGTLYTFSPSFYSHNYFLTFDVGGAITAIITVMTFALLFYNYKQLSKKQITLHSLIGTLSLFGAINTKFSNYLLLFLLIIFSICLIIYYFRQKKFSLVKNIIKLSASIFGIVMAATWVLYSICYRNPSASIPNIGDTGPQLLIDKNWLTAPIFRLVRGLLGSLFRSTNSFDNFVGDHNQAINYGQFINRVFWFKENPGLIIGFVVLICILGVYLFKNYRKQLLTYWTKAFTDHKQEITIASIIFAFPVLYVLSAWNTTFTIGYRHFYPALIFIYFGFAFLIYKFLFQTKDQIKHYTAYVIVIFYILYGLVGIPQTYNYVNFLWTKPKWQLTTDSTLSWADGGAWGLRYLTKNQLLQKNGNGGFNTKLDVYVAPTFPVYIAEAAGKADLQQNIQALKTDITKTRIKDLKVRYLVADIYSFQKTSNNIYLKNDPQGINKENLDYLLSHKPIYEEHGVAFIYDLN